MLALLLPLGAAVLPSSAAATTAGRLAAVTTKSRGLANPSQSLHPSAAFKRYCFEANHKSQCNTAALADIDKGRAKEGLRKLTLPAHFASMSAQAQLRVVANRERNVRGLASMDSSAALNAAAQRGAADGSDPSGPNAYSWGSNISWGYVTPLAADFGWMYDDGTNSPNIDCTHAGAAGCWGHRDNILAHWRGKQGDGAYVNHGTTQLTELFVQNY